ncbi:MAG TPA: amino acid adenylation domain-containing protein, partial [Thermoanaerobaculia bacterium]|nr:amino acid adenylation domain-containing protein [Thermoanaerobaculia bacterium]
LRTGDLGFFADGELYVTGRLKDLVILRGRNHYPQDLELTAERAHPALRPGCGAAFAVETPETGGEERLVIVQELERRGDGAGAEEVASAIRQAIAEEHEVQVWDVVLLRSGTIPKTSSGKIQRHACRAGYLKDALEVVGRSALEPLQTSAETLPIEIELSREALRAVETAERPALLSGWLRDRAARLLRTSPARIDPDKPLTALGLDSLAAVELKQTVESALGVQVSLAGLLEGLSISELAVEIGAGTPADTAAIEPSGVWSESPLSYGQKALWFLQRLAPESAAYHITAAVRVAGDVDVPALHRAFQGLVDRHPALRATFPMGPGGEPVQRVRESAPVGFIYEDAEGLGEAALMARLAAEAYRSFDLENGPLLRAALFRRGDREHALVLAVHHIAADFWSLAVAFAELARLYTGEDRLAPLPVSFGDFIRWEAERLAGPEGERLWSYWREALAGPPADLDLPADRSRPPVQTDHGSSVALALGPELTARVYDIARNSGSTLFMTLLAAFQALLHRWSGQEDFAVGSPVAGRSAPELAGLVGYFVDPVVLRADLAGNPAFAELLGRVRRTALGAFEHQGFPFPLLTERLQPARDPSRSPLFQAMLILQKAHRPEQAALAPFALGEAGAEVPLGPLALSSIPLPDRPAQLDLTLMLAEGADGLGASFQLNTDLFDVATIERMAGHFRTLLAGAVAEPGSPVRDLPLLTPEERAELVCEWNATAADYPRERLVHELFEEQADRTPERPALVHDHRSLTYLELERRANQLAHHLMKMGVGPEVAVGVHLDRSPDMAVSVLGVLKTGAGYLPLDPAYPEDRVSYMLEDAGAPVVLTQERLEGALAGYPGRRLRVDADWGAVAGEPESRPTRSADPDNFAYLIYTSGSTGRPKGVQVRHRGVVNFLASMGHRPGLGPDDVLVAVTTLSFDIAGLELYLPWMNGARVVLASREDASDGTRLLALLRSSGATVMQATPSTWRLLIAAGWEGEPRIKALCGGEALPRDLAEELLLRAESVWNLYGPTETTIWSAVHPVRQGETTPAASIGRPIANTGIFLLDSAFRPVPVGVPGELLIGGDGLARGYFRRPELTADRFIPDAVSGVIGARGERLYRTGDLVRWRADGNLEFLGRLDHQVKIRGHRVELGEIEAALSRHPAVKQSVVVARGDASGGQRLVAYVVAADEASPEAPPGDESPGYEAAPPEGGL